ncbi:MAG: sodium:proton antiporter [Planctomycetota bacterium]|nr:MAG: sodium:proton antiporter [Planctomycetota bacterium]
MLADAAHDHVPGILPVAPFVALLLCIAILPLIKKTEHWWHHNSNKLLVAVILGLITLAYYYFRGFGFGHGDHAAPPGMKTVLTVLDHAVLGEFIPFISLLFSLYVISGGINVRGDIPAHPITNTTFLAIGGLLASFIGTTGASMLLIRPLLATNSERKHVVHTVIFFIFIVSNIGGCLLPIGDPPLFLGFLRGVPFLWTLHLWKEWAFCIAILLVVYYIWDSIAYKKEELRDIVKDETQVQKLRIDGKINFLWLAGVVFVTATLDPTKPFLGTNWTPFPYLREIAQTAFVGLSLLSTSTAIRKANEFNYAAILEVACLFIGIFVCMQVPIEILNARGASLGIDTPAKFFWATGALSSFLDNAPTYVVFFETANAMTTVHVPGETLKLLTGQVIRLDLLVGISLGAVFMGANTYIGNGPNFMVKSIAEHSGLKMPSFFGYMGYSVAILIPLFVLVQLVFL